MDRTKAKALRIKLENIFAEADMAGMTVEVGNATYNHHEVTFKVMVRDEGAAAPTERDLVTFANIMDLDTNKIAENKYRLVGYKSRARKNPWIVKDIVKGGEYVINDITAKRWFTRDVI